jgi:hypothetical protein
MKILIKLLKMQLSLKTRADQVVKVANQDLNYQDFKFKVSKCCLVRTDILSKFSEIIGVELDLAPKSEVVSHD